MTTSSSTRLQEQRLSSAISSQQGNWKTKQARADEATRHGYRSRSSSTTARPRKRRTCSTSCTLSNQMAHHIDEAVSNGLERVKRPQHVGSGETQLWTALPIANREWQRRTLETVIHKSNGVRGRLDAVCQKIAPTAQERAVSSLRNCATGTWQ